MSIHHSITSRGLLIIDSEPTDVGSGHMWKFIVSRAPTNMLQTCARYVTRIMCDFPLESTAPTKTNIPKHRLAQLYDYATHPWSALILKITKKVMNQHYLCTASPGWMGVFFHFIPCISLTSAQTRMTWCHLNNVGRYVSLPRRTSEYKSGILIKQNIDLFYRQHRHVTDAQRWSSIAPSSLHLSTQLPAEISKQRDFLPLFTLSRTTIAPIAPIPQRTHKKPTRDHNTANMVTRYTTKGDGAAVQDPGRANSERAIQGRNTKKWMDGIMEDSDGELDSLISKLQ